MREQILTRQRCALHRVNGPQLTLVWSRFLCFLRHYSSCSIVTCFGYTDTAGCASVCHNLSFFFFKSNPAQWGVNRTNPYVEDENFFFFSLFSWASFSSFPCSDISCFIRHVLSLRFDYSYKHAVTNVTDFCQHVHTFNIPVWIWTDVILFLLFLAEPDSSPQTQQQWTGHFLVIIL